MRRNMGKEDGSLFNKKLKSIKTLRDHEKGKERFEKLYHLKNIQDLSNSSSLRGITISPSFIECSQFLCSKGIELFICLPSP